MFIQKSKKINQLAFISEYKKNILFKLTKQGEDNKKINVKTSILAIRMVV